MGSVMEPRRQVVNPQREGGAGVISVPPEVPARGRVLLTDGGTAQGEVISGVVLLIRDAGDELFCDEMPLESALKEFVDYVIDDVRAWVRGLLDRAEDDPCAARKLVEKIIREGDTDYARQIAEDNGYAVIAVPAAVAVGWDDPDYTAIVIAQPVKEE